MSSSTFRRGLFVAILAAAVAAPASGDIKAFNAAVRAGDYKTAAAEANAAWPSFDKSSPDTAVVAREFGFASYVGGDYASAREFALFLKEQGARLATPDDQPKTSAVLLAASDYRLGANADTRKRLFEALKARLEASGLDNVSVLASEALYRGDWAAASWANAGASAGLAAEILTRGGEQLAPRAMEAKAVAASAGFLSGPDKDDYDNLVNAHDSIIEAIDAASDPAKRRALIPLKYQVEAWATSVANYFRASEQIGSNIPKNVRWRELRKPKTPLFPVIEPGGAICRGRIDVEGLRYPASAGFKGMVGTVIMKFDSDSQGRVTKSETLASVPARHFAETVEKAAPEFRLKPLKEDAPGCSFEASDRVIYFVFSIL